MERIRISKSPSAQPADGLKCALPVPAAGIWGRMWLFWVSVSLGVALSRLKNSFLSPGLCFLWNKRAFLVNAACSNFMLLIALIDKCVCGAEGMLAACVSTWQKHQCVCVCVFRSMAFFQRYLLGVRNPGACFQWRNPIPQLLSTRRLNLFENGASLDGSMYQCVYKCHPMSRLWSYLPETQCTVKDSGWFFSNWLGFQPLPVWALDWSDIYECTFPAKNITVGNCCLILIINYDAHSQYLSGMFYFSAVYEQGLCW